MFLDPSVKAPCANPTVSASPSKRGIMRKVLPRLNPPLLDPNGIENLGVINKSGNLPPKSRLAISPPPVIEKLSEIPTV